MLGDYFYKMEAVMLKKLLIATGFMLSQAANASDFSTHSMVSNSRSGYEAYNYFSQSIEGGFGSVFFDKSKPFGNNADWKAMMLRSELGTELIRFFKLSGGFIKSDYFRSGKDTSIMDRYTGFAEIKIFFGAPIFNVEIGIGATASSLDVVADNEAGSYTGSGTYYTVQAVRYINSNIAFFTRIGLNEERHVKDSGSLDVSEIDIKDRSVGFGISIFR